MWVGTEWLSKRLGYAPKTVWRWLRDAAEEGGFTVLERPDASGRVHRYLALDEIGGIPAYETTENAATGQAIRRATRRGHPISRSVKR